MELKGFGLALKGEVEEISFPKMSRPSPFPKLFKKLFLAKGLFTFSLAFEG